MEALAQFVAQISKATVSILLSDDHVRAETNEVNVETLISSTILA